MSNKIYGYGNDYFSFGACGAGNLSFVFVISWDCGIIVKL